MSDEAIMDAELLRIDPSIEESVTVRIGQITIKAFASVCPYELQIGHIYPVRLYMVSFDHMPFREVSEETGETIVKINDAWGYTVTGRLGKSELSSGHLKLLDDGHLVDMEYLRGCKLEFTVDRLDIWFL